MTLPLKPIAACLILAIATPIVATAQQPTPRTVILLDPSHGGPDTGARLPNDLLEKNLVLAFANTLRAILTASGFTVISTRDSDSAVLTPDQRAEIANHAHPTACLVLHATSSGNGIHIVTSALSPDDAVDADAPHAPLPWQTAQAASIPQSRRLANELGVALLHAKLPVLLTQASVRPLDNLTSPAIAIEIAPFATDGSDPTPVTDLVYQQRIAQSIAVAITSWRTHNAAPATGVPR